MNWIDAAGGFSRRNWLKSVACAGGAAGLASCAKQDDSLADAPSTADYSHEEYVWISPKANLPLYQAHDHPALRLAGKRLGVQVTIAGPNTVDIPSFVTAIETTTIRRPAGMMVVGWDPSAAIAPINKAIESGVPVICVDGDVPASKRLAFVGTDWYDLGVRQGEAMLAALSGRRGKVAMLGLTEQYIDQRAFAGFRSVVEPAGLTVMEPQHDRADAGTAARVAATMIQATPDLVGLAGAGDLLGPFRAAARELCPRPGCHRR